MSVDWLSEPKLSEDERLARYFYLVAALAGAVIKVLVVWAAEARVTWTHLKKMKPLKNISSHAIGAAVILARQGYAKMAQEEVHKLALRWHRLSQRWGRPQLTALMRSWERIEANFGKKFAKKVQGRSARVSGASWLRGLLKAADWKAKWDDACELAGAICCDPAASTSVAHTCTTLARLPGVGDKYGTVHMARCCHVWREWVWRLPSLPLAPEDWHRLSNMNEDTTGKGFGALATATLLDARIMRETVVGAMKAVSRSSATRALIGRMLTIELSCGVCEMQAMLNDLERWLRKQGNDMDIRQYILERLPGAAEDMHRHRMMMHGLAWAHPFIHTGRDEMRAAALMRRQIEQTPQPLPDNAWQRWTQGSYGLHLPSLWCTDCGEVLDYKLGTTRQGSSCLQGFGCRRQ